MWILEWEDKTGRNQTEAPTEHAAHTQARNLTAQGITRVTYWWLDDQEDQ